MKISLILALVAWFGLAIVAGLPSMDGSPARWLVTAMAVAALVTGAFCWRTTLGPDHKARRLSGVRFTINALLAGAVLTSSISAVIFLIGWYQTQ